MIQKGKSIGRTLIAQVAFFFLALLTSFQAMAAETAAPAAKPWYTGITPIIMLLAVLTIVFWRMPKVKEDMPGQLSHREDKKFRYRRALNWLVLGLMYAFLYWGRYNINDSITALGGKQMLEDFNWVFGVGTVVYGISFLINGPLTDKFGGRFSILLGVFGAAFANLAMGLACWFTLNGQIAKENLFWILLFVYPINMYFQSFGAVAIVKCNSAWFHVRERGVFGAIFGILIALGLYFAFDWTLFILKGANLPTLWAVPTAFFAPATALIISCVVGFFIVRNRPSEARLYDIKTGDATSGDNSKPDKPLAVFKLLMSNPVIVTIACIEFCSGFLRQAIMQLYRPYAKAIGGAEMTSFVYNNWGLLLCCAGILGGVFAGTISDHVFKSRRGPVAAILYCGMLLGAIGLCFLLGTPQLSWLVIFMTLCIIGVHGMLSGTAPMDFAGSKNTGIAVGIIDGFVYLGTGFQAILYANTLPEIGAAGANDPSAWWFWPTAMIPIALIGLVLAYKIRNKSVKPAPAATVLHPTKQ